MKNLCRGLALVMAASLFMEMSQASIATSQEVTRVSLIGKYDSADTCTIRSVDTENKKIKFRNHATGKGYTLDYDNTSFIYDEYGRALSAALLQEGDVVDIRFLKSTRHLTYMQKSQIAWTSLNVNSFDLLPDENDMVEINGESYHMDRAALIIDDGELVSSESILPIDSITVKGIDKEIYSIVVDKGHGYLSLSSDNVEDVSLVGSWIELDNVVIRKVTPNMLLSVAEGEYKMHIMGNGADYTQQVEVSSNHETVIDTSKIEIEKPKEGLVTFEVTPVNAQVFVDGEEVIAGIPQSIVYGYHSLKVMADGYITVTKYLKVGSASSVVSIDLEKDATATGNSTDSSSTESTASATAASSKKNSKDSSDSASSASTTKKKKDVSGNSATTASTESAVDANGYVKGYKINVLGPEGAAVYFNGNYVGIAPVSIKKKVGTHAITIDEDGTVNSYTILIDSDKCNVNLTFPTRKAASDDDSADSSSSASSADSADSSSSASSADSADSSSSASSADSADSSSSSSSADSDDSSSSESTSSEDSTSSDSASSASSNEKEEEESGSSEASSTSDEAASDSAATGACLGGL
ncbi:MAG: PEGA domain-containing protein [Butyrivibrio sp.]|nr:PEGA domain-containing protein [Butyrivibrio sp.]